MENYFWNTEEENSIKSQVCEENEWIWFSGSEIGI